MDLPYGMLILAMLHVLFTIIIRVFLRRHFNAVRLLSGRRGLRKKRYRQNERMIK